jgi:hypothetical protein
MKNATRQGASAGKSRLLRLCEIALALVLICGCGGRVVLDTPKSPGTAAELAGTTWTDPGTKTTYSFEDEVNVEIVKPDQTEPLLTSFAVNDGIVDIEVGLTTLNGTWDGKELIIEGSKLKRE